MALCRGDLDGIHPAEAIRWGEIAHGEASALGHKTDTAHAAVIVAEASNNQHAWDSAATWANTARSEADIVGDHDLAQWAQFERARADWRLGNDEEACAAFETIFRAEIDGNRWRARASMIQIGAIDARRAVPLARLAATHDLDFYGPQAAVRLVLAARAERDEKESSNLWMEAVDLAARALASSDITPESADRAWTVVVESIVQASDELRPALVDVAVTRVSVMNLAALGNSEASLSAVDSNRIEALVGIAWPICDRYEHLLADLSAPTAPQFGALAGLLWSLARGLRSCGRRDELIEIDERMVSSAGHAFELDADRGPALARCLTKYGYDLGRESRHREGFAALTEAARLLDAALDQGVERWADLCWTLTTRAQLAGACGETTAKTDDLQRSQSIIDRHRSEEWAASRQRWLDTVASLDVAGEG